MRPGRSQRTDREGVRQRCGRDGVRTSLKSYVRHGVALAQAFPARATADVIQTTPTFRATYGVKLNPSTMTGTTALVTDEVSGGSPAFAYECKRTYPDNL